MAIRLGKGTPRPGRPKGDRRRNSALEIQIHPNNIRRGVRYIFLTRRQVLVTASSLLVFVSFLVFGLYAFPLVVGDLLRFPEYQGLLAEREVLGKRLPPLIQELRGLDDETQRVRLELDRIYLAYGLDHDAVETQGGYPLQPETAPDSMYQATVQDGFNLQARIVEQQEVLGVLIQEVQEFERLRQEQMLTTPSLTPLRGDQFVLTSPFGNRRSPFTNAWGFHAGIDLAAPIGLPVYAPADARVVYAGRYNQRQSVNWWRYGNLVVLGHGDDFITLYAHLDEIKVRRGQQVRRGDLLATVGNTGFSTNPHLHYEIRRRQADGKLLPVDPRIYMFDLELSDQERGLVAQRKAPNLDGYEPLPRLFTR